MGVIIKVNDAVFTNYVALADYPIISSLKNLYFMGGTAPKSTADKSGNGNNGTIVGTVTINGKSANFSGTGTDNKMTAQNVPTEYDGITVVSLFKKSGNRAIVSTGGGTVAAGTVQVSPQRLIYLSDTDSAFRDITYTIADSDNYYIGVWLISPTSYHVYVDRKDIGLTTITNGTGTGTKVKGYRGGTSSLKPLTIGGSTYGFAMNGTLDLAACAFYDEVLTQDQIKNAVEYLRGYGEKQGITIN